MNPPAEAPADVNRISEEDEFKTFYKGRSDGSANEATSSPSHSQQRAGERQGGHTRLVSLGASQTDKAARPASAAGGSVAQLGAGAGRDGDHSSAKDSGATRRSPNDSTK